MEHTQTTTTLLTCDGPTLIGEGPRVTSVALHGPKRLSVQAQRTGIAGLGPVGGHKLTLLTRFARRRVRGTRVSTDRTQGAETQPRTAAVAPVGAHFTQSLSSLILERARVACTANDGAILH